MTPEPPPSETAGVNVSSEQNVSRPRIARRRLWLWITLAAVLLVATGFALRHKKTLADSTSRKGSESPPVPVVVTKAVRGNIGVYLTGLGAVTPINTVTVRSRVDGELTSVLYKEGDLVMKGDPLVEIDSRPFRVQLTQAEGQLLKDQATLDNARVDLARYETLVAQKAAPEQQLATQQALVKQEEGVVKADQGTVDNANLNIAYCQIAAPLTGRVGLRLVDPGNIVHASDANGLLVITQMQPISVIFTIPEDDLPAVVQKLHAGIQMPVDAYDREMTHNISTGSLATVDNQVDQTTGTLKLRAAFGNENSALFPNQFVNARLLLEEKKGVVLIATAAIQRNAESTYVYLVKPDSSLEMRQIKLGTTEGEQSEVTQGLAAGDVVVMTGVDKLQEGMKVAAHFPGNSADAVNAPAPPVKP